MTTGAEIPTSGFPCGNLWCEVLLLAIYDAVYGPRMSDATPEVRLQQTLEARRYLTEPNEDFDLVCLMVGMDPEFLRERVKRMIAVAGTPENVLGRKVRRGRSAHHGGWGVVNDLTLLPGTGGGTSAQEIPNLGFRRKDAR